MNAEEKITMLFINLSGPVRLEQENAYVDALTDFRAAIRSYYAKPWYVRLVTIRPKMNNDWMKL